MTCAAIALGYPPDRQGSGERKTRGGGRNKIFLLQMLLEGLAGAQAMPSMLTLDETAFEVLFFCRADRGRAEESG